MPELIGIAVAPKLLANMEEVTDARIEVETGIDGDARGRKRRRQVTILFQDDWNDACQDLKVDLPWTTRRANLFVSGIRSPQIEGQIIRINDVELEVNIETVPCELMDKQHLGLKGSLEPNWRGGLCCSVIKRGKIKIGDQVILT